jgi:hypothetical protein
MEWQIMQQNIKKNATANCPPKMVWFMVINATFYNISIISILPYHIYSFGIFCHSVFFAYLP